MCLLGSGSIRFYSPFYSFFFSSFVEDICWLSSRAGTVRRSFPSSTSYLIIPACSCICFRLLLLPASSRALHHTSSWGFYFYLFIFFLFFFGSFFETWLSSVRSVLAGICWCLCALLVVIITSVSQVFAASTRYPVPAAYPTTIRALRSFPVPLRPGLGLTREWIALSDAAWPADLPLSTTPPEHPHTTASILFPIIFIIICLHGSAPFPCPSNLPQTPATCHKRNLI